MQTTADTPHPEKDNQARKKAHAGHTPHAIRLALFKITKTKKIT